MKPDYRAFAAACARLGLELTKKRYDLLCRYTDLLTEWNQRVNLISRKDTDRILPYHIIDSLAVHSFIPKNTRVCDIGTGGGLPGIPLAIVLPDNRFTLVESVRKKAEFLALAADKLRLHNTGSIHDRAEDIPPLDCAVVLSRLTGPIARTLPQLATHCAENGSIILYKSPKAPSDLTERLLNRLKLRIARTEDLNLPLTGLPRRFIILNRN